MPQNPFIEATIVQTYAENPQPRCPSLLLLDVSASMAGQPLQELQEGLAGYRDSLFADSLAKQRVEVAVMTFGGSVDYVAPFATVDLFTTPTLTATSDTPMGRAIVEGLQNLDAQKAVYRQNGIAFYRPWVFLITDGAPTDKNTHYWSQAKQMIKEGLEKRSFLFFAAGVQGADMDCLRELCPNPEPLKLRGLEFKKLFAWLSSSQQAGSRSQPGETLALPAPTGWAEITA